MAIHIVVDGYNLIRQSPTLSAEERLDAERARKALNRHLAQYKRIKGHAVTVVYDGARGINPSPLTVREEGVRTIYSGHRESADDVIMRMADKKPGGMVVVTSDREVADYAGKRGAVIISSQEFEARMDLIEISDEAYLEKDQDEESRGGRITTRKKGPSRRPSRKERRKDSRFRKL